MSDVTFSLDGTTLTASLSGEIDQHTAAIIRAKIDGRINASAPNVLALDMNRVSFMDSSGIGLIMGRYKKMQQSGGRLVLCNLPSHCERIVAMSGITRILNIEERRK